MSNQILMNFQDEDGRTALHLACNSGDINMVKFLLNAGIDSSVKDNQGNTAVHLASKPELINLLIWQGIDQKFLLSDLNMKGRTILHEAASNGNLNLVTSLLRFGANPSIQDNDGNTSLHLAITSMSSPNTEEMLTFYDNICSQLIEAMKDNELLQIENNKGQSCLILAINYNNSSTIKIILQKASALINHVSSTGLTALHFATSSQKAHIVRMLLEHESIDIEVVDQFNRTPLHFAILKGNCDLIQLLLSKGAQVETNCFQFAFKFWEKDVQLLLSESSKLNYLISSLERIGHPKKIYLAIALHLINFADEDQLLTSSFKKTISRFKSSLDESNLTFSQKDSIRYLILSILSGKLTNGSSDFVELLCDFDYANISNNESTEFSRIDSVTESDPGCFIKSCLDCKDGLAMVTFKPCNHQISCQVHAEAMKICKSCGTEIQRKLIMDIDGNVIGEIYLGHKTIDEIVDLEEQVICSICWDQKRSVTFVPCGHGACSGCAEKLTLCHMDRVKIITKIKMKFP